MIWIIFFVIMLFPCLFFLFRKNEKKTESCSLVWEDRSKKGIEPVVFLMAIGKDDCIYSVVKGRKRDLYVAKVNNKKLGVFKKLDDAKSVCEKNNI